MFRSILVVTILAFNLISTYYMCHFNQRVKTVHITDHSYRIPKVSIVHEMFIARTIIIEMPHA